MSDTESYVYRFSWDTDDLASYPWKEHYVKQPEVLAYLNHVADKHGLRKDMRFNTQLLGANWDDANHRWNIKVTGDIIITARYLVTGLGLLSKQNYPNIPGIHSFEGDVRSCNYVRDLPPNTHFVRCTIQPNGQKTIRWKESVSVSSDREVLACR